MSSQPVSGPGRPTRLNWRTHPPYIVEFGADQVDWTAYAEHAAASFAHLIQRRREIQPSTAPEKGGVPTAASLARPAAESVTVPASTGPSPDLSDRSVIAKGAHEDAPLG